MRLDTLAKQTPGFSGADLANLINEAAILAARRNKKTVGMPEMEEAIDRVIAGPERRSRLISEREKLVTAYHEGGHAVVGRFLKNHDPVHKISIIARGMMGGYTRYLPTEDRYLWTKSQFEDRLAATLGGHAAEKVVFGEMSTGAENDIEVATNIARKMVKEYGMTDRLGPVALGHKEEMVFLGRDIGAQKNYSEKIAEVIDEEIRRLIDEALPRGRAYPHREARRARPPGKRAGAGRDPRRGAAGARFHGDRRHRGCRSLRRMCRRRLRNRGPNQTCRPRKRNPA